jgi:hypothetical protein
MKKLFLLIIFFASLSAMACDICGCSVSNYNPNLFPQLSKKYLAIGYTNREFVRHIGLADESTDRLQALTIAAGYKAGKKLHLTADIPVIFQNSRFANTNNTETGVGDLTLLASYRVWEKMTKNWRQNFSMGGGIKLPTGRSDQSTRENGEKELRMGTGSIDYLVSLHYLLAFRKWAVNTSSGYKYNTQDKNDFRMGDQWRTNAKILYRKDFDRFSVAPHVILDGEIEWKDAAAHALIESSDSRTLFAGPGLDLNTTWMAVGVNYIQALTSTQDSRTLQYKPAFNAYFSLIF